MTKEQLMAEICCGRNDAFEFINSWLKHAHEVDDLIDNKVVDPKAIVLAFVNAHNLFTNKFYLAHKDRLYPIHLLAAVAYVNSNSLEESHKLVADSLRSFGNQILIIVAGICTPEDKPVFDRMCWIAEEVHKQSWTKHHDENNKPI